MSKLLTQFIECIVYKKETDKINYLVLKRSEKVKLYPHIWQIVTGTIEENEKAYQTAIRELKEETGIVPIKFYAIPHVNTFYYAKEDIINLVPIFLAEVKDSIIKIGNEHSDYKWLDLEKAVELIHFYSQKEMIKFANKFIVDKLLFKTLTEIKI